MSLSFNLYPFFSFLASVTAPQSHFPLIGAPGTRARMVVNYRAEAVQPYSNSHKYKKIKAKISSFYVPILAHNLSADV